MTDFSFIPTVYQPLITAIIAREGGYSNNPNDAGGETNYGITAKVWRANGFIGEIRNAPRWMAGNIYFNQYIANPQFDFLHDLSVSVGDEVIDTGVNMGPVVAGRLLQRALNAFNFNEQYGKPLIIDGVCGSATRSTLIKYVAHRGAQGERVLLAALNGLQAVRYIELTEAKESQRQFAYGWINGRVANV